MNSSFKQILSIILMIITGVACNCLDNLYEQETLQDGKHVCKMIFKGAVSGYDGALVRDANTKSSSWSEGDILYITFFNGNDIIPGNAYYSSTDGWLVSYEGDLAEGSSQPCEVRYFVNPTFANDNLVSLNSNSEIYEDVEGYFNYSEGYITLNATLTPKVGRIRFTGNATDRIYVTGITTHTNFSPSGNRFSTTSAMIPLTVEAEGSTPYVYGFFTYDDRKLGVVGSDFAYTRTCASTVFQIGSSGYMKIPSPSSHMNWRTGLIITVNNVDFKMLPVAGYSGGFFLMAETETTCAQYSAVTGDNSTGTMPMSCALSQWLSFINTLNYATSFSFYLLPLEEWRFAASGGNLSQGYTYSGSNSPGDVAWYESNSGGQKHQVKQLSPNELGFYDMSGNIGELVLSGGSYYCVGGDYTSNALYLQPTYYPQSIPSRGAGLRLAMRCN